MENESTKKQDHSFVNPISGEALVTTELDYLIDQLENVYLDRLNGIANKTKEQNAYYLRIADNHIEIGYSEVKFQK